MKINEFQKQILRDEPNLNSRIGDSWDELICHKYVKTAKKSIKVIQQGTAE